MPAPLFSSQPLRSSSPHGFMAWLSPGSSVSSFEGPWSKVIRGSFAPGFGGDSVGFMVLPKASQENQGHPHFLERFLSGESWTLWCLSQTPGASSTLTMLAPPGTSSSSSNCSHDRPSWGQPVSREQAAQGIKDADLSATSAPELPGVGRAKPLWELRPSPASRWV